MKNILFISVLAKYTYACMISSVIQGSCLESKLLNLSFCKDHVSETICVPLNQKEWNWTVWDKEAEIRDVYISELEALLSLEISGQGSEFVNNVNCPVALKDVMCRINLPDCANDTTNSLCGAPCTYLSSKCLTKYDLCSKSDVATNTSCLSGTTSLLIFTLALIAGFI
jgi:hypothetical protein